MKNLILKMNLYLLSLRDRKDLQIAKKKNPVYWVWEKDQIKRIKFEPIQSREKIS